MGMKGNNVVDINLAALLKEKCIHLDLESNDKQAILAELVEIAARSKRLLNRKILLKATLEREALGSTGIGNGVAIPHGKSKAVKDFILVFARKGMGVDFGALDGEKTYLFFLLASPEDKVGMHLKILSEISRMVKDKFVVEQLKKAKDKKEVIRIIADFKKNQTKK